MVWLKHYRAWAAWQGGVGPLWPGGGATIRVFDVFHQFIVFLRLRRICNCCNNIFSESNNDIDRATTILGLRNRVDSTLMFCSTPIDLLAHNSLATSAGAAFGGAVDNARLPGGATIRVFDVFHQFIFGITGRICMRCLHKWKSCMRPS